MFYTVYKITNTINGKFYIGVHKTDDLNDGYMGSGKLIKAAIEKYGIENFTREYLHVFDNAEDMFKMESELVNEEFAASDDTYNIMLGGNGGWDFINAKGLNPRYDSDFQRKCQALGQIALAKRRQEDPAFNEEFIRKCKESLANGRAVIDVLYPNGLFYGKKHSEKTKSIMREKAKLRTGEKNSSFGSMWITNGVESKKIKKDDLIPDGWRKGRKMLL